MKKIPTLFVRDFENNPRLVLMKVTPGCEWVIEGEGVATRKWDGTCCKIEGGKLYKRYEANNGKTPPEGFIPAQDPDPNTGHWPGWLKVGDGPEDKWLREAFDDYKFLSRGIFLAGLPSYNGTFEAVGPKINGNRDSFLQHMLIPHGNEELLDVPRDYEGLKQWLSEHEIEGIVFHHPDGRMCKIKRRDFGLKW